MICFWYFSLHLVSFLYFPSLPAPSLHFKGYVIGPHFNFCRKWARGETRNKWLRMAECLLASPPAQTSFQGKATCFLTPASVGSWQGLSYQSYPPRGINWGRERHFGIPSWLEPEPRAVITLDFLANLIERISISLFQNADQFDSR